MIEFSLIRSNLNLSLEFIIVIELVYFLFFIEVFNISIGFLSFSTQINFYRTYFFIIRLRLINDGNHFVDVFYFLLNLFLKIILELISKFLCHILHSRFVFLITHSYQFLFSVYCKDYEKQNDLHSFNFYNFKENRRIMDFNYFNILIYFNIINFHFI